MKKEFKKRKKKNLKKKEKRTEKSLKIVKQTGNLENYYDKLYNIQEDFWISELFISGHIGLEEIFVWLFKCRIS